MGWCQKKWDRPEKVPFCTNFYPFNLLGQGLTGSLRFWWAWKFISFCLFMVCPGQNLPCLQVMCWHSRRCSEIDSRFRSGSEHGSYKVVKLFSRTYTDLKTWSSCSRKCMNKLLETKISQVLTIVTE